MQIHPVRNQIPTDLAAQQAQKAQEAREAQRPLSEKPVEQAAKAAFYQAPDEYTPQEPAEASGRYWMDPSGEGPKVNFDQPEKAPASKDAKGKPVSVTTTDTDQVDREIERARKKVEDLQNQASQAQGPQRERLERQLKQAQSELERKDNDAYRRQHAKIS